MSEPEETQTQAKATPLRSLIGAVISGALAFAAYSLMSAIATSFAAKPLHSNNVIVLRISSAVRTLVLGIAALGSGVFAIVAIGLVALAIQLFFQQLAKRES
ncbi:hypothetical protein NIES592_12805 [Fischerella major NIES-592]|uniref:DUF3082 domain-containing protein n=2 Tax=Fischerella TaxID=1190 RepID=A0A1U7GYS1_9CYAN|nr:MULTISPECIES: DUF3082 domain-containing protein [Fischerella]OKH13518.1 hypothetical protein NIES592_12805 [Fischerella major NIES-592]PMB39285.1 DUF3082 domain-containing protein [Fischerella thermalis CCMEE 5330]BAU06994.1 hypothetical protein FIS3754_29180 [Fischerella sp. NIES-3754]BCX09312.1 MAG: hypothetical protein KatS3mg066_3171 [Fischerella sp.]